MSMLKFFRVPFALSGTKTPVPDTADPSGYVSYIEGYGVDYQRAKADPLSKNIERDKMNQVLFDATNAIGELQAQGIPDFITSALNGGSPFSYAQNAMVRYGGVVYLSLVAANTALPSDPTKWSPLTDPAQYLNRVAGGVATGDVKLKTQLPYTASTAFFFGDSITTGVGASPSSNSYANLLIARMGWTASNLAISGGSIMDWIINAYNQTINPDTISVVLPGFNDARFIGTNAAQQTAYQDALYAACAFLAIPEAQKIKANDAAVTFSGVWATSPIRSFGKYTNNQNASATFKVSGTTVYCSVIQQNGNGGVVRVDIDGVTVGSFDLNRPVANGGAVSSINYMPMLLRFPGLSEGLHTVVLTKTDATDATGNHALSIDFVAGNGAKAVGQSKVFVGSTLRMNATGAAGGAPYNKYTEPVNRAFTKICAAVCGDLAADGLEVQIVRTNSVYNPDNPTEVDADNIHPSNLGHSEIYQAFLNAIQNQGRLAPVTGALAGLANLVAAAKPFRATYTPTLFGNSTPGTITYTVQEGEVLFDGLRATVSFRIVVNAISVAPTGPVAISVPFPSASAKVYVGSIGRRTGITSSAGPDGGLYCEISSAGGPIIVRQGNTASELDIPWANIAAGAEIRGTITYPIA